MVNNKGFSFAELMIVVAMVGILFAIGPQIFIQLTRFLQTSQAKIELQREARGAISTINKNLREAYKNSIFIDRFNSSQPYCSRISFTRFDGVGFTFYQNNMKLTMVMQRGANTTTRTLSENLKYLAFTPPRSEDLSIISVSMTFEKGIYESKTKALHMASEKVMVMNE